MPARKAPTNVGATESRPRQKRAARLPKAGPAPVQAVARSAPVRRPKARRAFLGIEHWGDPAYRDAMQSVLVSILASNHVRRVVAAKRIEARMALDALANALDLHDARPSDNECDDAAWVRRTRDALTPAETDDDALRAECDPGDFMSRMWIAAALMAAPDGVVAAAYETATGTLLGNGADAMRKRRGDAQKTHGIVDRISSRGHDWDAESERAIARLRDMRADSESARVTEAIARASNREERAAAMTATLVSLARTVARIFVSAARDVAARAGDGHDTISGTSPSPQGSPRPTTGT